VSNSFRPLEARLVFPKSDLARYPFTPEAAEYINPLDLKIDDLANPEFERIVARAEERIEEALRKNPPEVSYQTLDDDIEIASFPVAVMMAAATNNDFIKRRYALAEATRVYNLLKSEDEKTVLEVADSFKWRIKATEGIAAPGNCRFALYFTDFLKNAKSFHEKEWKLINRVLWNGWVYLGKQEVTRLLQEEVRKHVERKLQADVRSMLPENVIERVDRLTQTYSRRTAKVQFEELPRSAVNEAFPPCIRQLYDSAAAGRHLSHVGRFALTSFLLRIGVHPGEVIDLFRFSADFNERMTRYQVEHIAGAKGSRTSYMPPKCDTLRTHGICPGMDDVCRVVRHPLAYYRRKLRTLKSKALADQR